jgi:hypothetical protein
MKKREKRNKNKNKKPTIKQTNKKQQGKNN